MQFILVKFQLFSDQFRIDSSMLFAFKHNENKEQIKLKIDI